MTATSKRWNQSSAPPTTMGSRSDGRLLEVSMGRSTHRLMVFSHEQSSFLEGEIVRKLKPVFGYLIGITKRSAHAEHTAIYAGQSIPAKLLHADARKAPVCSSFEQKK